LRRPACPGGFRRRCSKPSAAVRCWAAESARPTSSTRSSRSAGPTALPGRCCRSAAGSSRAELRWRPHCSRRSPVLVEQAALACLLRRRYCGRTRVAGSCRAGHRCRTVPRSRRWPAGNDCPCRGNRAARQPKSGVLSPPGARQRPRASAPARRRDRIAVPERPGRPYRPTGTGARTAARRAFSLTFSITQRNAGIDIDRCRRSARCGMTGLQVAAGRGARRCCEPAVPPPPEPDSA
jgi:hypothetical protein